MPNFRLASCWSVDVMNGAAGERRALVCSTSATRQLASLRRAASPVACSSPSASASLPSLSRPVVSSKSLPVARRCSPRCVIVASNATPPLSSVAARSKYDALMKSSRSHSRSTRMRTATDWTRPAESLGAIFFQRTGETE